MDRNRAMLLWFAAGAGIILLYASFKGKSPTDILSAYATSTATVPAPDPNDIHGIHSGQLAGFAQNANGDLVEIPAAYANTPALFVPSVGP